MVRSLGAKLALAAFAGTVAITVAPAPSRAAGLFDAITSIFGADPAPMSPRFYGHARPYGLGEDTEPLGVTVRGSRRRVRAVKADAPGRKPVNTAIDPVKHPDWYLHDPTLRRGDIIVLKNRVLVVEGGAYTGQMALTPLDRSRLLSRSEREKVRAMARLPAETAPVAVAPVPPARTKTAAQADRAAE